MPTGRNRTHLGLLYFDDTRAGVCLLGKDRGMDLSRRLIVVNAALCELFLLLVCMEEMSADRANRRECVAVGAPLASQGEGVPTGFLLTHRARFLLCDEDVSAFLAAFDL